jgi:hypothetical protein
MKKKRGKKRQEQGEAVSSEEQRDELLALSLIYCEDLSAEEDGSGFSLVVLPHPGEAETNHVRVRLRIM